MNERFTALADSVSEALGNYLFTIVSLVALAAWIVYGAVGIAQQLPDGQWFTSQQWNFPLNTITTVGEWFIGALVAAAANRVEKRNRQLNERELSILGLVEDHAEFARNTTTAIRRIEEHTTRKVAEEDRTLKSVAKDLELIRAEIARLKKERT